MGQKTRLKYAAFVAYSRTADARLAKAVARSLGSYGRPWYRRRALRVVLGDDRPEPRPRTWPATRRALDRSEFLILLGSPGAAASTQVGQEVDHWLAYHGTDGIVVGLTGGQVTWPAKSHTTALPPALVEALTTEPDWIDLRQALDRHGEAFDDAVISLAARLSHRDEDTMVATAARRDLWRLRMGRLATTLVVGVILVGAYVAYVNAIG